MTVTRNKNNDIVITVPANTDIKSVEQSINYLIYKELVKDSKATQEDADELAREVNKKWWEENKHRFLKDEDYS